MMRRTRAGGQIICGERLVHAGLHADTTSRPLTVYAKAVPRRRLPDLLFPINILGMRLMGTSRQVLPTSAVSTPTTVAAIGGPDGLGLAFPNGALLNVAQNRLFKVGRGV